MDLILWRHADAADAAPGESDFERALTGKGRTQAKRMAAWLNERLPADSIVLASPARRAQQTAAALEREVFTSDALNTGTDCKTLLAAVHGPREGSTTVVVGHQPTLGQVASFLLTGAEGELSIRKGAVWWLRCTATGRRTHPVHAVLLAVMTPDLL
jgi:phosphohistidine phosphatase